MNDNSIHVKRTATVLRPDQSRVLLRPFIPEDPQRAGRIIARIMSLPENRVGPLLDEVSAEFSQRHQQIHKSFLERFEQVRDLLLTDDKISEQRKLLIGSYFVCEFSLESAALFNPSIVPHPDQSDLPPGAAFYPQLARHRGGTHFLHHFSDGYHPRRPSDRGPTPDRLRHRASSNPESPLRERALRA